MTNQMPSVTYLLAKILILGATLNCVLPSKIEKSLVVFLAIVGIIFMILLKVFSNQTSIFENWKKAFILFFVAYFLSLIFGVYGKYFGMSFVLNDFPFVSHLIMIPSLTFAWSLVLKDDVDTQLKRIGLAIIFALTLLGLWGLFQWANYHFGLNLSWLNFRGPIDAGPARAYQGRPMAYAWQLSLWVSLAPWLLINQQFSYYKKFIFFSFIVCMLGGLASGNRTFYLVCGLSFGLAIIWGVFKKRIKFSTFFSCLIVISAMAYFSPAKTRIVDTSLDGGVSLRKLVWKAQSRAFFDNPIYGVGRDKNRLDLYFDYSTDEVISKEVLIWNAHNLFLDLLASMGILGFLGFFWILMPKPFSVWKLYRSRHEKSSWLLIWTVPVLAWLSFAMIQSPLETPNALMMMGVLFSFMNYKIIKDS